VGRSRSYSTVGIQETMMAELLDSKDIVGFKELLIANTIQITFGGWIPSLFGISISNLALWQQ
jgi:hypothetical protein